MLRENEAHWQSVHLSLHSCGSVIKQESRAVAGKPRDAAVNFDRYKVGRKYYVSFDSFTVADDMAAKIECTRISRKSDTENLEFCFEVIQGHTFWHKSIHRV